MVQAATRRSWRHKSVLALMQGAGRKDAAEIIRAKARDLVSRAREKGWSGPPFDPLILASLLGIRCRPSATLFTAEAQLSPQPGRQLLLEFNPDRPDGRRNYSICHEIVHTFFDDCYELVHHRMARRQPLDADDEIEILCQIGASELLMPLEEFDDDLNSQPFSLRSVPGLANRYAASREAVMRRLVFLGGRACAAVFLSHRLSPREKLAAKQPSLFSEVAPTPKFRVVYSVPSPEFSLYIPAHKSVPDHSCINSATMVDDVRSASERWNIAGFGDWTIEAIKLPTPDDADDMVPTVAAMIHAN